MKNRDYIKLFSNCIVVKGAKRSTICDIHRNKYKLIPNSLGEIIVELKHESIDEVLKKYSKGDQTTIKEYLKYLVENEFAFFCDKDELALFPDIKDEWDYPGEISNAIIDIDKDSNHDFKSIFNDLEDLGCNHLLIRSFCAKKNILLGRTSI